MKKSEFKSVIDSYIISEQESISEHNAIKEMLKPLEGKQFNHRTFSEKNLNGFKFESKYGMFHIKGKKFEHLIGYDSDECVSVEKFEKYDACCGSAAENRIKQIENTDFEKAFKIFNDIDKHFNLLRKLFGDLEREKLESFLFPLLLFYFEQNLFRRKRN